MISWTRVLRATTGAFAVAAFKPTGVFLIRFYKVRVTA